MELLTTISVETVTDPAVVVPAVVVAAALCTGLVARVGEAWQDRPRRAR